MKEIVTPQERQQFVLSEIRKEAEGYYSRVKEWTHGLLHVEEVVEHIKALAEEEGLNVFVSEVTGWLHDIGRALEEGGGIGSASNHAYLGLWPAEKIMLPYEDVISEETRWSILEAIKFHSHPVLPEAPENISILAHLIQVADRGAGMGHVGVLRAASFVAGIEVTPTNDEEIARHICENTLWGILKKDPEKRQAVIDHCDFMMEWYTGLTGKNGEWKVSPMNIRAGKERFRDDCFAIINYRERLLAL